jgi:hypothetical protein
MSFQYLGFTSTYSCDGLAEKLRLLLQSSGARSDVKSEPGACAYGYGVPDKFASADLTFYTLSPESAPPSPGLKPVEGLWKPVAIAARSPQQLGTGDCELVKQYREQVLKLFTTRALDDHSSCIPYQNSGSLIDLKFEVFTAVPTRSGTPGAPPAPIAQ